MFSRVILWPFDLKWRILNFSFDITFKLAELCALCCAVINLEKEQVEMCLQTPIDGIYYASSHIW